MDVSPAAMIKISAQSAHHNCQLSIFNCQFQKGGSMIEITYHRKKHRVELKGHALAGAPGQDIVCAAASMLAHTLAANVQRMAADGDALSAVIRLRQGDGEVGCCARSRKKVTAAFDTVCAGFALLAQMEPEHVSYMVR
jgi:uncharacterized protein YsxB (DUF464 family)